MKQIKQISLECEIPTSKVLQQFMSGGSIWKSDTLFLSRLGPAALLLIKLQVLYKWFDSINYFSHGSNNNKIPEKGQPNFDCL